MARARCADLEPGDADYMFFTKAGAGMARRLCAPCPVASACLALALEAEGDAPANYRAGMYAGTTPGDRARAAGAYVGAAT